ncbi:TonB-dependent receptor [Maricaulis parjimensis]|uniref:TonB-dependent receptor n=1 Tax=Maricaulis parjimensis TaxID=144023 RepID=UPI00193AD706|nr:TonB-dependent receptor [Maricaulis parjimensis]
MTKRNHGAAGLLSSASIMVVALAAPVWAQDEAETTAPGRTQDVITVTAQRREQTLNEVAMDVQAFSGDRLEALRVTDVGELTSVVSSFNVSQSYQGVPTYTMRGVGFNTINLSATSTVGTYVDQVAYPYPMMNNGPTFDIQRVEVLKGPQGTLFGRNTTAGLINLVTNRPQGEVEARGTVELGNYQTLNTEGMVNLPLNDSLQMRLAFRQESSDEGWQRSRTRDETQGEVERLGARLSISAQPSDTVSFDFTASGWTNRSDTLAGQAVGFTPATVGHPFNAPGLTDFIANNAPTESHHADWAPYATRSADIGTGLGISDPLAEDSTFMAYALRAEWEINDSMRLVSLTSYNDLDRSSVSDWSGAPYELLIQSIHGTIESFAEEIRLEGEAERFNWMIGGYYGRDEILDTSRTLLGQNANVGLIRFYTLTLLGTPFDLGYSPLEASQAFRTYGNQGDFEVTTMSVFASADWNLSDDLTLTTGLRYSEDQQDYRGCSHDFNGNMLPNVNTTNRALYFQAYGVFAAPISEGECNTFDPQTGSFGYVTSDLKEDNIAWRLALNWLASDDVSFYGSISRGAKAGGAPVNEANIADQNAPANQELLLAYEVGTRASLFDGFAQLNAALFYYDYEDKQLSVNFADPIYTALSRLNNVPEGEAYGLDAEVTFNLTDNLTAIANATWLHTQVIGYMGVNAAGQPHDFDGQPFLYSPEFTGAVTLLYDRTVSDNVGFRAALNARHQTEANGNLEGAALFQVDGYTLMNASASLYDLDDSWEVSIWGRNLADEYYWTAVASGANSVVRFPGEARTWGISLTRRY